MGSWKIACAGLAASLLVSACGGDDKPAPKRENKVAAASNAGAPTTTPGGPGKMKVGALAQYSKIPQELRKDLDKTAFTQDPTGDVNRDPFRSYLIDFAQSAGRKKDEAMEGQVDDCARTGVVAPKFGLRDLKLSGIVLRGTKSYALFTDGQMLGHSAARGDCVSKEKARIKDIGADRVTIEIRGEAPPGAPAPPPREEVWRLFPDELDVTQQ